MDGTPGPPHRVLPVQLVPLSDGVIIKRGRMELRVGGSDAYQLVLTVLDAASRGLTFDEVLDAAPSMERSNAVALWEQLVSHRLIVGAETGEQSTPESPLDLFHWSAGVSASDAAREAEKAAITVVGVGEVSRALVSALIAAGFHDVHVVHYPFLCNLRMLDDAGEIDGAMWPSSLPVPIDYARWSRQEPCDARCLVATSDFGGLDLMRAWNGHCFERGIPFLPVVLQDLVGYLGPLTIGGRTACFECARARQNANFDDATAARATEPLAFVGQGVTAAYHPALPAVLGNFAALEVSRFIGGWGSPRSLGTLIEVDLLAPALVSRPVLKLPRCPTCGDAMGRSGVEVFRRMLIPGTHEPHA